MPTVKVTDAAAVAYALDALRDYAIHGYEPEGGHGNVIRTLLDAVDIEREYTIRVDVTVPAKDRTQAVGRIYRWIQTADAVIDDHAVSARMRGVIDNDK